MQYKNNKNCEQNWEHSPSGIRKIQEVDIVLKEIPAGLNDYVIGKLRLIKQLTLDEAYNITQSLPKTIYSSNDFGQIKRIVAQFEEIGCKIKVKQFK